MEYLPPQPTDKELYKVPLLKRCVARLMAELATPHPNQSGWSTVPETQVGGTPYIKEVDLEGAFEEVDLTATRQAFREVHLLADVLPFTALAERYNQLTQRV